MVTTPFIGTRYRWLAPLGAADLDGDGTVELAYIDRPHLARVLRIWRYENGTLTPLAEHPGLTNHRIGEDYISGGIRRGIRYCGETPEIITANADWTRLIASTLSNGKIKTRDIDPHTGPASFAAALACTCTILHLAKKLSGGGPDRKVRGGGGTPPKCIKPGAARQSDQPCANARQPISCR